MTRLPCVAPEIKRFGGEWYSLLWVTGLRKSRAEQAKRRIKELTPVSYSVRLHPAGGAYYIYVHPPLSRQHSQHVLRKIGGV